MNVQELRWVQKYEPPQSPRSVHRFFSKSKDASQFNGWVNGQVNGSLTAKNTAFYFDLPSLSWKLHSFLLKVEQFCRPIVQTINGQNNSSSAQQSVKDVKKLIFLLLLYALAVASRRLYQ